MSIKIKGITIMCGENWQDISLLLENISVFTIKNNKDLYSAIDNDDIHNILIVNPENNLHPKLQTHCAEMIVLIAKKYNKKILLTTNSFHFLEALVFFIGKYGYAQPVEYFLINNKDFFKISDSPHDIMDSLSRPSFDLADMKLEFKMENE